MVISHQEFRQELDALSSEPGAIEHSAQDGGTLAPTTRLPAPTVPGSRRTVRSRTPSPDPIALAGSITDAVCTAYSFAPESTIRALSNTTLGFLANRSFPGAVPNTLNRLCRATPGWEVPDVNEDFPNGQCVCSRYAVTVNYSTVLSNGQQMNLVATANLWGPILDISIRPTSPPTGNPSQLIVATCRGNRSNQQCQSDFVDVTITNAGTQFPGIPRATITNIVIVPVGGDPDSCGGRPPVYRDPVPSLPTVPDIDIDVSPGVSVRLQPQLTFNADATLNIDVGELGTIDVDINGIEINLNPPPGAPPGDGDGGQAPTRPDPGDTDADPANPAPPPPPDDPAVEEPEEEPEEVIRAVLVTVTDIQSSSSLVTQEDTPDVYVPDLGLVSFRCRVSDGASGWTPDIRVKNVRCFIPCPYDGGAIDVQGTPRLGVTWTLTPVYDLSSIPSTP